MNRIFRSTRHRFTQIASRALITAAAIAASGLLTQCSPPLSSAELKTKRGACKKWADDLKNQPLKAEKLRKAFATALRQSADTSAEGMNVREKLRESSESARDQILDILKKDETPPIFDANFPAEAWFKFYEPEVPRTKQGVRLEEGEKPEDHCLHIFDLPEPGTPLGASVTDKTIFETYLRCCYQPW